MHAGSAAFLERVKSLWRSLTPQLEDDDLRLLEAYRRAWCITPYRAARMTGFHVPKAYRRAKRLVQWRLLIPGGDEKLTMSIKGCIALYVHERLEWSELQECACRVWELECPDGLAGFLYLLGLEAERRGLNITTMTMCMLDEASTHVLRYFRRMLAENLSEPKSVYELLEEYARELDMPVEELRGALRMALYGIARLLPLTINTDNHKVLLLASDTGLIPVVLECRRKCGASDAFGIGCPIAAAEVRERLLTMLNHGLGNIIQV